MSAAWAAPLAGLFGAIGWRLGWLSVSGCAAAVPVGTAVLVGGGAPGATLLATFFVSGSLLARRRASGSTPRRTAAQVLANGWTAGIGAVLIAIAPGTGWAVLSGGLAAAQADTWSSEIGTRLGGRPVLITNARPVARGTSGGVTVAGTVGGMAGALALGVVARLVGVSGAIVLAAATAGIVGMMLDSLLGATVQARFECPACGTVGESARDACAARGRRVSGVAWIGNDAVNAIGTAAGAALAVVLARWFAG